MAVVEVASEADRTVVGVVLAAAEVVVVIGVFVLTELADDETSTISGFVELALVLTELVVSSSRCWPKRVPAQRDPEKVQRDP